MLSNLIRLFSGGAACLCGLLVMSENNPHLSAFWGFTSGIFVMLAIVKPND